MNIRSVLQRYPIATYFVLAFAISWGWTFIIIGPASLRGETFELSTVIQVGLLILTGPMLAGILSTYIVDGKKGLQGLLSRMLKWRVGLRWYAAAILTFPVLIVALLLVLSTFASTEFTPSFTTIGIMMGLFAGFLEEIGWTGYAYPKMQKKFGALRAALFLGLMHGLWHIGPNYLFEGSSLGVYWLPRFTVMWMVAMVAMRVILVWIYTNTGSLLLAQLTHASSTGALVVFGPSPIAPASETLWWGIYAIVLWIVAGIIIAKFGEDLIWKPKQSKLAYASME
jgi:membrane protease YdiL (CAAX protease family)